MFVVWFDIIKMLNVKVFFNVFFKYNKNIFIWVRMKYLFVSNLYNFYSV